MKRLPRNQGSPVDLYLTVLDEVTWRTETIYMALTQCADTVGLLLSDRILSVGKASHGGV